MEKNSKKELVKKLLSMQYGEGVDENFIKEHTIEDFSWVVGIVNEELHKAIPWAGIIHKKMEGYYNLVNQLFGEYEVLEFLPKDFHETEKKVFVEGYFKFQHKKTKKIAETDYIMRFDFEEDKIVGGQMYENTFGVAESRKEN